MAIVVTGATGQLGELVVRHLIARGTPARHIVAAGRNPARLREVARHGVHHAEIDYTQPESLDAAFGKGDTVLFVSSSAIGARIQQHGAVVKAAQRAGVGRLVYTSVVHADSIDTVLTPDHRATEQLIRDSGLPFTILRNNLYAETVVDKVVEASERNEFVTGWGDGRIAGAARTDYAEGAAVVLADPGRDEPVYELTADTAWGGEELAVVAAQLLGKPITYQTRTSDETEVQLALAGVPEPVRDFTVSFDQDVRQAAFADVSHVLTGLIGRPTTPLIDALRAALPGNLPQAPATQATAAGGAGD